MTIDGGNYYKEITFEEGNVNNLFVNTDYIFKKVNVLFFLEQLGFEVAPADIFIRIENAWMNILTGSIILDSIESSSYNVVLDGTMYSDILNSSDYDAIQS